jgi:hypothetical protein
MRRFVHTLNKEEKKPGIPLNLIHHVDNFVKSCSSRSGLVFHAFDTMWTTGESRETAAKKNLVFESCWRPFTVFHKLFTIHPQTQGAGL